MKFAFHPAAEEEFLFAIAYYEECKTGLGYEFSQEVYLAIQRALRYPFAWQELSNGIRRTLVHRFPYGIIYSVEAKTLFILAVMHLHREPFYWKERI